VIDLDRMDEQLGLAVGPLATPQAVPPPMAAPAPVPRPQAPAARVAPKAPRENPARSVRDLLELGLAEEAYSRMSAATDRLDVVTWANMRALLEGRQDVAAAGIEELSGLARTLDDPRADARYWTQRFWAGFQWGVEEERHRVLDHCRTRAYRFDDLRWWGNLTLLLAAMGKADEAARAFDEAVRLLRRLARDELWLDVTTNLIEAAALLGDPVRMDAVHRSVAWPAGRIVVVGPGVVCKGSVDRYRGLSLAALGRGAEAGACFDAAAAAHRALGAAPLLARTLQQATGTPVAA
jgi:tetratricopeptide (TPR) repeat protein